jgi:hypothetical protein
MQRTSDALPCAAGSATEVDISGVRIEGDLGHERSSPELRSGEVSGALAVVSKYQRI